VKIEARTYTLEWQAPHHLAGLVIKMRSRSIGYMESIGELQTFDAIPSFAENIVSWNLEYPAGGVVPIGAAEGALQELEPAVIRTIVLEWLRAAWGTTSPLEQPSGDGQPSPDTDDMELSRLELAGLSNPLSN
jgi:hypothetical protein